MGKGLGVGETSLLPFCVLKDVLAEKLHPEYRWWWQR